MAARLQVDLNSIVTVAQAAGETLLSYYRHAPAALDIELKGPRDLVTAADRASEQLILDALTSAYPEHQFLSEEQLDAGSFDSVHPDVPLWIIDPLDGTTNFAHGHPMFAVSIGLWWRGQPQQGVIHAPALGETFSAERGAGGHWHTPRTGTQPLRVSDRSSLKDVMLATGFSYERKEVADGSLDVFGQLLAAARGMRRSGSAALDLAYTAAGILGGFWEYYLQPHDVAAGALLVLEAGGRVTDVRGENDFLHGGSIAVGNPALHEQILAVLRTGPRHPGPPRTRPPSPRRENRETG